MTPDKPASAAAGAAVSDPHPPPATDAGHAVYVYPSSGIAERKGKVPIWLWLVAISLAIWGIYYLIAYWNPAAPPT